MFMYHHASQYAAHGLPGLIGATLQVHFFPALSYLSYSYSALCLGVCRCVYWLAFHALWITLLCVCFLFDVEWNQMLCKKALQQAVTDSPPTWGGDAAHHPYQPLLAARLQLKVYSKIKGTCGI